MSLSPILNFESILKDVYHDYSSNYLSNDVLFEQTISKELMKNLDHNKIKYHSSIPYYTLHNIKQAKQEILDYDEDCIIGIFGKAGKGKTTVSFILSFFLDPQFNHSRIIFTFNEFLVFLKEASQELQKEESTSGYISYLRGYNIVIDEGVYIFFSSDVNTKQGKLATKLLTVIRFLNLVVFINATNYERLNKLLRETRLRMCVRIREKGIIEFRSPKQTNLIQVEDNNTVKWSEPSFTENCGYLDKKNTFWSNYTSRKAKFTFNTITQILREVS